MIEEIEEIWGKREEELREGGALSAVRMHFYYENQKDAAKIIDESVIKKIEAEELQIKIEENHNQPTFTTSLKKKLMHKSLHHLKVKKRVNKKTKEVSYRVEECNIIKNLYDYQDMCDFLCSQGTDIVPKISSKRVEIDKDDLLAYVKGKMEANILNKSGLPDTKPEEEDQLYKKLIRPEYFLKQYNHTPPQCDFFVNKVKKTQKQFNNSYSINYEDQIPVLKVDIPQAIRQTALFSIVKDYMQKRPCWLKNTLLFSLKQDGSYAKFTINQLKNVLKYTCFTFKNGPWKHTFCAFGFNPRQNYKSVIYQNVSLKLKKKEAQDYEDNAEQELYDPTFTDISTKCVRAYQLGDIAIQGIRQIINGKLISEEGKCTKEHGWLSANEHHNILKIMKEKKDLKTK